MQMTPIRIWAYAENAGHPTKGGDMLCPEGRLDGVLGWRCSAWRRCMLRCGERRRKETTDA
jgi:hypothetical protein